MDVVIKSFFSYIVFSKEFVHKIWLLKHYEIMSANNYNRLRSRNLLSIVFVYEIKVNTYRIRIDLKLWCYFLKIMTGTCCDLKLCCWIILTYMLITTQWKISSNPAKGYNYSLRFSNGQTDWRNWNCLKTIVYWNMCIVISHKLSCLLKHVSIVISNKL